MVKYVKLHSLFEGFLETLDIKSLNSFEKRLINLIRDNFDRIVEVGIAKGQRAQLINGLIKKYGKDISDIVTLKGQKLENEDFPIKKITSLEVERFRGFTRKETFSFDKPYTLVYGPNGSGKSSFCDALEYALLGYINEAIAKRIDVYKYIANVNAKKGSLPVIKAINHKDEPVNIEQMPEVYNFCFIEKNRISDFARISANTPTEQKSLISTLFGLEEFNKFVINFTDNFGDYIDIKGKKREELDAKKQEIANAESKVKDNRVLLENIESEKKELLILYSDKKTFEILDLYIHGEEKKEAEDEKAEEGKKSIEIGRIKLIEKELNKPISDKYFIKEYNDIEKSVSLLEKEIRSYKNNKKAYDLQKEKVSYKNLYEAVIELEAISKDKCPACLTPIKKTAVDPFKYAQQEIKTLKAIAELEQIIENEWTGIIAKDALLREDIKKLKTTEEKLKTGLNISILDVKNIDHKEREEYLSKMEDFIKLVREKQENIDTLYKKGIEENNKIDNINTYRGKLSKEKEDLEGISGRIKDIKTREKLFKDQILGADAKINKFNEVNKNLIKEVDEEKELILENKEYLTAYNSVIYRLKAYNEKLPLKLIENLNDITRDFYNVINTNDKHFELLDSVKLPVTSENTIKITFQNNKTETFDALHILSEGHIRCLGLAILLAKNVADDKGIIIFDDVVNAIDDEHREGIRELLFKEKRINTKQIILTSHAEQFIKDLDNQFKEKEYAQLIKKITFLRPSDARSILVDTGDNSSNYLIKAQECIEKENKQGCLMNCRLAIENIVKSLWKKLHKTYNMGIKVKLKNLKEPFTDLMNIVEGLRGFLEKDSFPGKNEYKNVVEKFKYLEGLETSHKNVWEYLNSGAHEEINRNEFDKAVVEKVLSNLKELDNAVK